MGTEYAEQNLILEKHHESRGIDSFVASASLVRNKAGASVSFCVWPSGVAGLLPRSDLVAVTSGQKGSPDELSVFVRFDDALRIGGELISRTSVECGPERFAIRGAFSLAQGDAFRAAAVDLDSVDDL
jgi:hypothetical protein